jgi:hypothetical protein
MLAAARKLTGFGLNYGTPFLVRGIVKNDGAPIRRILRQNAAKGAQEPLGTAVGRNPYFTKGHHAQIAALILLAHMNQRMFNHWGLFCAGVRE